MSENTETLKGLLNDLINNRTEQAQVTLHDYFVAKTREISGLDEDPGSEPVVDLDADPPAEPDEDIEDDEE